MYYMKYQSTTKYPATPIFHFTQINAFSKDTLELSVPDNIKLL